MNKTLFKISRTHIGDVRAKQQYQMTEVCELLNWTIQDYCEHQYKEYERFMHTLAIELPVIRDRIRHSDVFRGFWNNEWAIRNREHFLPVAYDLRDDQQSILEEYKFIHKAMRLIHDDPFYNRFENILKLIK